MPLLYAVGAPLDGHLRGHRGRTALVDGAPAAATNASDGPCWPGFGWEPSAAEVDAAHAGFCDALVALFDKHKAAYGWAHKRLRLV